MSYKLVLCDSPEKFWSTQKAVKWKIVTEVGVAPLHPPILVMGNISPCLCPNPLRLLIFHF